MKLGVEVPFEIPYTNSMKNKKWTIEIRDIKVRQPFAPLTRKFKNLKAYNRKRIELAFDE
jgi:hypothetical protein